MTRENGSLTKVDLWRFTGTENWYRHAIVRDVLYTDGVRYLAEHGGAYWLLDEIALAQRYSKSVARELFQVWTLTVGDDRSARLVCNDGNGRDVFAKHIPFTDFPLTTVTLYVTINVILLPSEY